MGSKNYNLESTNLGRNLNSDLIPGKGVSFYEKKKEVITQEERILTGADKLSYS